MSVIGEVGGRLGHVPAVAGRADPAALAGDPDLELQRFGYRLDEIVKDAQRQDAAGDRKVVRLSPGRPEIAAAKPGQAEPGVGVDSR
jgi:hypothetical protein